MTPPRVRSARPFVVLLCALGAGSLSHGQAAAATPADDVYLTVEGRPGGLTPAAALAWRDGVTLNEKRAGIFVEPARTFQTFIGIGGAITDAAAETLAKLPADKQEEVVRAYYDPVRGIGYTLARTNIHSCDFSSESYTYVKDGDTSLASFSVAHDERYRLPLLRRAIAAAGGQLNIFASPWSPPAWMKDNGDMLHGGKLKPEFRDAWARYFAAFVKAYRQEGVPIWGLTVQNEPMAVQRWESCVFSAEDERDFIRDHLGPVLAQSGLGDVKLIAWDHNRGLLFDRARTLLDDPAASRYIWGIGFHWYVSDCY
jgi:glucosylceramidase